MKLIATVFDGAQCSHDWCLPECHPNDVQRPERGLKADDTARPHARGLVDFARMVYWDRPRAGEQRLGGL